MESRVQKTLENHKKGYNCAQAVACAYCCLLYTSIRKIKLEIWCALENGILIPVLPKIDVYKRQIQSLE